MTLWPFLTSVLVLGLAAQLIAAFDDEKPIEVVTYGSTIKLEHVSTKHRLHSHDVSYGTGSGQQSVTGLPLTGDSNSYWIVRASQESAAKLAGTAVHCGDVIRLQHLNTAKNLHSHEHRAPMNRDYEVSAYSMGVDGKWARGDDLDNWVLECVSGKGEWKRFDQVRLKHQQLGSYLSASSSLKFGDPIPGQLQISGSSRRNANTLWKTNEGFYIAPMTH